MADAKFIVGQMIQVRLTQSSEYKSDCVMVIKSEHAEGIETGYTGWFYRVDRQPNPKKWIPEIGLRELPPHDKAHGKRTATRNIQTGEK